MSLIAISIYSVLFILFFILAVLFSMGKGAALIAGYNSLPKEEKAAYDEEALCKFMGKMTFGMSFSAVLWIVGEVLGSRDIFLPLGFVLIMVFVVVAVIFLNTGDHFQRGQ